MDLRLTGRPPPDAPVRLCTAFHCVVLLTAHKFLFLCLIDGLELRVRPNVICLERLC